MARWHFQRLTDPVAAAPYRRMTFPRFRPRLRELADPVPPAAVALAEEIQPGRLQPAGLALAVGPAEPGAVSELLSLYVDSHYRRRGLGRRLLAALEDELARRGAVEIRTVYMTRLPLLAAFEAVLRTSGWSEPHRRMYVFRTDREHLAQAQWFHLFEQPPAGVTIEPWGAVPESARARLRESLRRPDAEVPPDVDPFLFEGMGIDGSPPEPALSFACRRQGEVVGWHLAHRIGPRSVRFSCSFIGPDLQATLPLLTLWRHAFQRLETSGYTFVSWAIAPQHEEMLRFNEHLLAPHVLDFDETRGSAKVLASEPRA